jgi:hypothetical protein
MIKRGQLRVSKSLGPSLEGSVFFDEKVLSAKKQQPALGSARRGPGCLSSSGERGCLAPTENYFKTINHEFLAWLPALAAPLNPDFRRNQAQPKSNLERADEKFKGVGPTKRLLGKTPRRKAD